MSKGKKMPHEVALIQECLGTDIASYEPITEGQDGQKFIITKNDGDKLFCRVKRIKDGHELPFQEAAILQSTTSPHIVRPIHVDQLKGYYILMLPYIEGTSLGERIATGAMSEEDTLKLANTLIDAVENLQEAGAIHFDIKPENIISGTDGQFYLVDFGAAHVVQKIKDERIHPARRYIAPEVLEYLFSPSDLGIQRLTTLTDMYGVGAVLYTCVTGRRLSDFFQSSSDVLQKNPPPVRHLMPAANPQLADLVDRLLSKDPGRRPLPSDARALLRGDARPAVRVPHILLKTRGGRGSEHASMLPVIANDPDLSGIYWQSANTPNFPRKVLLPNLLWETPVPSSNEDLETALLAQQTAGVIGLCVSGAELDNPLQAPTLNENVERIRHALVWRKNNATHLPVFPVLPVDAALLISDDINTVRDAYAALQTDGLILRVCVSTNGEQLDVRHLVALRDFIRPWVESGKPVLLDGDLSVLILSRDGVSGLICSTFPKAQQLASRAQATPPKGRPVRPDGLYVRSLLGKISADQVASLRGSPAGRALTNCTCPHCAMSLMRRNRFANWTRAERRGHFVYVLPREMRRFRRLSVSEMQEVVANARRAVSRFKALVPMNIPHLEVWASYLSR